MRKGIFDDARPAEREAQKKGARLRAEFEGMRAAVERVAR